jgi:hypothetical protein
MDKTAKPADKIQRLLRDPKTLDDVKNGRRVSGSADGLISTLRAAAAVRADTDTAESARIARGNRGLESAARRQSRSRSRSLCIGNS